MTETTPNDTLCALCRAGQLFAIEEWFRAGNRPDPNPPRYRQWAMGVAIDTGFHSVVEVLLRNGVPADADALAPALSLHRLDMIELLFRYGADPRSVPLADVVHEGHLPTIKLFLARGADLVQGYPFYHGLIRQTRMGLGLYKQYRPAHPELQFQADMALGYFARKKSMRGVSLLMWLGANPRAKVPGEDDEDEEDWCSSLEQAAREGDLAIIERLGPDPAKDDVNGLLSRSIWTRNMQIVQYWISMGADMNHMDSGGKSLHSDIVLNLSWACDTKLFWSQSRANEGFRSAKEWFAMGAKWPVLSKHDRFKLRKCLLLLKPLQAYELIKLFRERDVIPEDVLARALDTPKLRTHLQARCAAILELVPSLLRWARLLKPSSDNTTMPMKSCRNAQRWNNR